MMTQNRGMKMSFSKKTQRLLGIAFIFQAITSLISETVSDSLIDLDGVR
jgi:hypothetical protein